MIKTVPQLVSPKYFFTKLFQTYQLQNKSLLLEHLEEKLEKHVKQIYNAAFSHSQKEEIPSNIQFHSQFLITCLGF